MPTERKNIESPTETRNFENGKFEVVKLGAFTIGKATFQPGWKWSTSVKPLVKTDSCQAAHNIFMISGKMKVVLNDGTETEFESGDAGFIPPGHDAWVVGNETVVYLDFTAAETYGKG